ncbi:MAG: HDOD domain-containing protein [Nitrospirota bacterium]|jgi:HD-like signal output (HDOD) protein
MTRDELLPVFETIKPLPQVAVRILSAVDDEHVATEELAAIVRHDVALHARVLKVANSALYGLRTTVDSVDRAITLLGRRTLTKLVISACAGDTLQGGERGYLLDHGALFRHGMAAGVTCELLGRHVTLPNPGLLYSACLLQDLGKIALDEWVASEASGLAHLVAEGVTFVEAESRVLGIDHAEVGAWLAEAWEFPESLVDAIRYHHRPDDATDPTGPRIVQFCDALCLMAGVGCGCDGLAYAVGPDLAVQLGIDEHQVCDIAISLAERLGEIDQLLSETLTA